MILQLHLECYFKSKLNVWVLQNLLPLESYIWPSSNDFHNWNKYLSNTKWTFVGLLANVSLHFYFFISDRWSHYLEQPLQNISVENSKQLKFLFQFSFVVFFIFLSSRWKTKATLNLKGEITLKLFLMTASRGPINNNKGFLRGHFKGLFSHLILLECYQDCNLTEQSLHYFTVPLNKRYDQTNNCCK